MTDATLHVSLQPDAEERLPRTVARGYWRTVGGRLRYDYVTLFFILVIALIALAAIFAPVVAPFDPNKSAMLYRLKPVGYKGFLLGTDELGRDIFSRVIFGTRTSLLIGAVATAVIMILGTLVGLLAGYFRGVVDFILRPLMELIWSFPVVILGVALGTALAIGGIGPVKGNSLYIPAFIIGVVYVPYLGKPIRGEVLRLREQDFIDAARVQGMGPWRIMFSEILPNVSTTIIVFLPLILANSILLEAYLSFLGAGVQAPNASWGTLISDGLSYIQTTPTYSLIPGAMLVLTVLSVNVVGDGVRDALDPRAQVRVRN